MRVSKVQAQENRQRILTEAARLFRERGIDGVGVDALTQAAGFSHGSLYSQFGSKEKLTAEALAHALQGNAAKLGQAKDLDTYVSRYLSKTHRDQRGEGCVMAALSADVARHASTAVRQTLSQAVRGSAATIAQLAPDGELGDQAALGVLATLVGALTLARAVDDPKLSAQILASAKALATSAATPK